MEEIDIDLQAFELHELYLRGVFERNVSSIAESANRRLKAKLKTQKKVDKFTQEVALHLSPLNKPIPATGKGIARFDGRPAPGFAFALQLFIRERHEQASAFLEAQGGNLLVYLAVLALSKEGDNRRAIDSLQGMLGQVEFNSQSRLKKQIAKKPRGESPLRTYLREVIRSDPDASVKCIYEKTVVGKSCDFGDEDEITLSESKDIDKDGRAFIEWEADVGGKTYSRKIKFATFEKMGIRIFRWTDWVFGLKLP